MKRELEIANFTCKFGDLDLLDFFEKWFYPSIKNGIVSGSRSSETLSYQFINLKLDTIDEEPLLCGYFVKSLNIKANQRLTEDEELIESDETMLSDPSSFFVLLLKNHKLLWLREVSRAPTIKDLRYAIEKMLQNYRNEELSRIISNKCRENKVHELENEKDKEKLIKKLEAEAYREMPQPFIEITPLGDIRVLNQVLNDFKMVKSIKIKALKKNNEFAGDLNSFISDYSKTSDILGSNQTEMNFKNTKEGLNKEHSEELLKTATDGNFKFEVNGVGQNDQKLRKTEDKISLKIPMQYDKTKPLKTKVRSLINKFNSAITLFNSPKDVADDIIQKALDIVNNLK